MNQTIRFCVGLAMFLLTFGLSAQETPSTSDRAAFERAADSLTKYRKTGVLSDAEIQWAKNLQVLAQSTSRQADNLLAQLALFEMDGAFAEEFSCAASKRGKNLSVQLRRQLKIFHMNNFCEQRAAQVGLQTETLCKSKVAFAKVVSSYRRLPMKDTEGACSY